MAFVFLPRVTRNGVTTKTRIWWAEWRDAHGVQQRKTTKAREKRVAQQIANELERESLLDPFNLKPQYPPKRWSEFTKEALEICRSRSRSRTAETYRLAFQHFEPISKGLFVHEVTVSKLQEFIRLRRGQKHNGKPISDATINKDLRGLRAALNLAVELGIIPTAPRFKGLFIREDRPAPVVIPRDNQAKFLAALNDPDLVLYIRPVKWWKVFILVIQELGVRRGEALNLRWESVNFAAKEITVTAISSKGRRYRHLPVSNELIQELKAWRSEASSEFVLEWPDRYHIRRFYDDWRRIVKAAGLPDDIVPKNFRSTTASEMISAGVPTAVVQTMLGHASITTTEGYYINTAGSLRAAAEKRREGAS